MVRRDYSDYQKLSAVAGLSVVVVDSLAVAAGIEADQIRSAEAGSRFETLSAGVENQ